MSQSTDINITYWSENYRKAGQNDSLVASALARYANAQNLSERELANRLKIDIMQLYQLGMLVKPATPAETIALAGGLRVDPELLDIILSQKYTITREFYIFKLENYKPVQVAGPYLTEKEAYPEAQRLTNETGLQHIVTGKVRENVPEPPKPEWADSPYARYYEIFAAISAMDGVQHTHLTESVLTRYYRHLYMLLEEDLPNFDPSAPLPPEISQAQEFVRRGIKEKLLHVDEETIV
jgi:hypothetical protein